MRFSPAMVLTLVSFAGAAALVCAGLSAADTAPASNPHLRWAMARSSLEHLSAVDPVLARAELDAPAAFVQGDPPLLSDPTPAGWSSTSTEHWTSFSRFAEDVAAGNVPA